MTESQSAEFDSVAEEYRQQHQQSIRLSGEDVDYFANYKIDALAGFSGFDPREVKTVVDFGAGIGNSIPRFRTNFPNARITALDVSAESLKKCADLKIANVETKHYDGTSIPIADSSVDIAFTACVFHHIEEEYHVQLLSELHRIMKPNGKFCLFEHNPWNPLTRHAVKNCPFDENAVLINSVEMSRRFKRAGFQDIRKHYHLFVPGYFSFLRPIETFLTWCPLGAQYSLLGSKS